MRERFSMQPCFNEETQQPASERLTKVCGQDSRVHKKTRQGERPSRDEPRLPDELLLKYFYLGPKIFLQKVSKNTGRVFVKCFDYQFIAEKSTSVQRFTHWKSYY